MPTWLKTVLVAALSLAIPWLQQENVSSTVIAILEEVLAFLQSQQGNCDQAAKDLLTHIQKVTKAA